MYTRTLFVWSCHKIRQKNGHIIFPPSLTAPPFIGSKKTIYFSLFPYLFYCSLILSGSVVDPDCGLLFLGLGSGMWLFKCLIRIVLFEYHSQQHGSQNHNILIPYGLQPPPNHPFNSSEIVYVVYSIKWYSTHPFTIIDTQEFILKYFTGVPKI